LGIRPGEVDGYGLGPETTSSPVAVVWNRTLAWGDNASRVATRKAGNLEHSEERADDGIAGRVLHGLEDFGRRRLAPLIREVDSGGSQNRRAFESESGPRLGGRATIIDYCIGISVAALEWDIW